MQIVKVLSRFVRQAGKFVPPCRNTEKRRSRDACSGKALPKRGVASPRLAQSVLPVCHRAYGRIHRPCKIRPSAERTTTCKGMAFSLPATACWTARWMPLQQGTSIRTTVTLRMSLASRSWVSLSR